MNEECKKVIESWSHISDIPLELSIELGRTSMKLKDILNLEQDSIIKLSRSTGEGVDVRVDNKSIVRGEVIVIEDKARIRVSEIVAEKRQ